MQWLSLALLLVVSVALNHAINETHATKTCPPVEIIYPCTCRILHGPRSDEMIVQCTDIKQPDTLKEAFEQMPNWHFNDLWIINSNMLYIPSAIFQNASFQNIYLKDSSFVTLFEKPPSSESLVTVDTKNVIFQRGLDWNLFSKLKVEKMSFYETTVKKLGQSVSEGIPETLEVFSLQYSNITRIYSRTFVKARRLTTIEINYGLLKKLDNDTFPKSIKYINFNYQRIQTLPDGIFQDLPQLIEVILIGNLLTTIKKEVFSNVKILDLHGNKIQCDCRLHWILKSDIQVSRTHCAGPSTVRGRLVNTLTEDDFSYCD